MITDRMCAGHILEVSPRVVHFMRTQARASSNLTVAQFRVLARLSLCLATNTELAERQGVSAPTMSRMVEGLVRRDLVRRNTEAPKDRRQVQLFLTKKGRVVFLRIIAKIQDQIEIQLKPLSSAEKKRLMEGILLLARLFP